jgi:O-antigen ligase
MPESLPSASLAAGPRHRPLQPVARKRVSHLLPLLLVFYSFLILPPEVEFSVFGVNFPAYRVALLLVSMPALWASMRDGVGSLQFMDAAVAIVGFWTMVSFTVIYGFEVGMVRGAGITIDTVLPYFITRTVIRSLDDLRYFLVLCLPGLIFAGAVLAIESLGGRIMLRPAFTSVFGPMDSFVAGEASGSIAVSTEFRMGMLRAVGPFPHPILAGIMMIGFLPLYYFSGLRSWPFFAGVLITLTGFFSLSSAAFLSLILAVGLIAIYHLKAYIPKISWWAITAMLSMAIWVLHMASNNGIIAVIARLTFTPQTSYYRISIWEFGSASVAKHPWFGIGYGYWDRPKWMLESVDAHFLLLAMRHGLVVPIMLLAAIIFGLIRLGMIIPYLHPKDRSFCIGLNICMIIFVLVGQTVNYFGSANLMLMAVIAFVASIVSWGDAQVQTIKRQRALQYARMAAQRQG